MIEESFPKNGRVQEIGGSYMIKFTQKMVESWKNTFISQESWFPKMFTDFLCLTHTIHGTTGTCTYICWIVMVNIGKHTGPINPMGKLTVSILKARDKSCRRFSTGFCVTQARSRCRALQPATRLEVFHWYPNIDTWDISEDVLFFFRKKNLR